MVLTVSAPHSRSRQSWFHVLRQDCVKQNESAQALKYTVWEWMNVPGILMLALCSVLSVTWKWCRAVTCRSRLERRTDREKKSLWVVTPEDERTLSLGVLQGWRRVLPQLCSSCLNSIQNLKRKTQHRWLLTQQALAIVNNSSSHSHAVIYSQNQYNCCACGCVCVFVSVLWHEVWTLSLLSLFISETIHKAFVSRMREDAFSCELISICSFWAGEE